MGYADALAEADQVQRRFVAAPDAAEGARALLEKRPPRFWNLREREREMRRGLMEEYEKKGGS